MPENILVLSSELPPGPGGIGNHAWNLAKYLAMSGFQVKICADTRKGLRREAQGVDAEQSFHVIRNRRDLGALPGILHRSINFARLLLSAPKGTLLIATGKFPLWFLAIAKTMRPGLPTMAIAHGSEVNFPSGWKRTLTAWSLRRYDKVIAVSENTAGIVKDLSPATMIATIPNGFDAARIANIKPNGRLKGEPALITVGTLSRRKGQHNVVEVLPLLMEHFEGLKYHMVGRPDHQALLTQKAVDLGVVDRIVFHGAVSDKALIGALKGSDLFLMLSEAQADGDIEGFGIAILEANACGVPAIGSLGCGIEDAISDHYSGRLVDPKNPAAILEAIQDITKNYERYSNNAREWAKGFTWEQVIDQYIEEIEN